MLAVDLENVAVDFPIYGAESHSLKKRLLGRRIGARISYGTRHTVIVHALRDVSLRLRPGRPGGLGLGGPPNGGGKSTLLRPIAGVYEPLRGRGRVQGRVTTLFSLQLGMEGRPPPAWRTSASAAWPPAGRARRSSAARPTSPS